MSITKKKLTVIDGETLMDMRLEPMNKYRYELESYGVYFVSGRSNGRRFLNIRYDPESDGSDVNDGKIRGVKTGVPAVPVVPVNEKPLTLRVKPSEAYYEKQRRRGRYR